MKTILNLSVILACAAAMLLLAAYAHQRRADRLAACRAECPAAYAAIAEANADPVVAACNRVCAAAHRIFE